MVSMTKGYLSPRLSEKLKEFRLLTRATGLDFVLLPDSVSSLLFKNEYTVYSSLSFPPPSSQHLLLGPRGVHGFPLIMQKHK